MAINLSDNILAKTTGPVDAKFGPYTGITTQDAISSATGSLLPSYRYEGLTVGLIVGTSSIVEYWFEGGVSDSNLVLKGGTASGGTSGTSGSSGISITGATGSSGTSGSSGSSGSSGTSATSGSSGNHRLPIERKAEA